MAEEEPWTLGVRIAVPMACISLRDWPCPEPIPPRERGGRAVPELRAVWWGRLISTAAGASVFGHVQEVEDHAHAARELTLGGWLFAASAP
jgi:hypothetical protein